jgi:hypothetical protein
MVSLIDGVIVTGRGIQIDVEKRVQAVLQISALPARLQSAIHPRATFRSSFTSAWPGNGSYTFSSAGSSVATDWPCSDIVVSFVLVTKTKLLTVTCRTFWMCQRIKWYSLKYRVFVFLELCYQI